MKTKQKFSLLVVVILFLTGCVQSLHPLYHDKDRLEVPEIVGKWQSESGPTWEFSKVEDKPSYFLKYVDTGDNTDKKRVKTWVDKGSFPKEAEIANMDVNIVKLGGHYFMDFYPADNKSLDNLNELLSMHLLATHTFAKLQVLDGQLLIQHLDPEWLEKLFDENKIRIKHEVVDGSVVLTASTKDLQKFISKYADDENAFIDPEVLNPYSE